MYIYALQKGRPIVVNMPTNPSRIVVTDGFHVTGPIQIAYTPQRKHYFTVACIVENDVLVGGGVGMLLLFFMGLTSGYITLLLLSISPVLYLLFLYYIRRQEFIQIRRLQPKTK